MKSSALLSFSLVGRVQLLARSNPYNYKFSFLSQTKVLSFFLSFIYLFIIFPILLPLAQSTLSLLPVPRARLSV